MEAPDGPRVFRPGATLVPLFFWSLLTAGAGALALQVARDPLQTPQAKLLASLLVALAMLFGPLAFAACLLRFCLVTVTLDPRDGLLLSRARTIPWRDIRSVELREAPLKDLLRANPLLLFFTAGCMALIHYVVFPSLALFTPWPQRVILRRSNGKTLVLRDLRFAEEFIRQVSRHIDGKPDSGKT